MKIDGISILFPTPQIDQRPDQSSGTSSFAQMMAASVSMDELAARNTPTPPAESKQAADVRLIKEEGFRAYAEEVQARKMSELREKILDRMGLSEEDLNRMPADQRAAIEKIIGEEIQRRMQANAELNDAGPAEFAGSAAITRAIADATATGGAGAALLAIVEADDLSTQDRDGDQLPDKRE